MRNTLIDLNNHLFVEIERLNDEELTEDELKKEMNRAKAMTSVASKIIDNATLMFEASKFVSEFRGEDEKMPKILIGKKNDI